MSELSEQLADDIEGCAAIMIHTYVTYVPHLAVANKRLPFEARDLIVAALRRTPPAAAPVEPQAVERVARAIVQSHGDDPDLDVSGDPRYDIDVSVLWEDYRDDARAAIAALASVSAPAQATEGKPHE